jgi:hypothetical protein
MRRKRIGQTIESELARNVDLCSSMTCGKNSFCQQQKKINFWKHSTRVEFFGPNKLELQSNSGLTNSPGPSILVRYNRYISTTVQYYAVK